MRQFEKNSSNQGKSGNVIVLAMTCNWCVSMGIAIIVALRNST